MTFNLKIKCDNEVFEGQRNLEVERILEIAARLVGVRGHESGELRDVNGNKVGKFEFVED